MTNKVSRRRALARLGVRVARVAERIPPHEWQCLSGYVHSVFRECAKKRGEYYPGSDYQVEARATLEMFR